MNRCDLKMRSCGCLNRDHDVLTITRAALTDSDQRKMSDVFDQ